MIAAAAELAGGDQGECLELGAIAGGGLVAGADIGRGHRARAARGRARTAAINLLHLGPR